MSLAAFLAAVYPGFWVLDVQILSEPLGLVIVGLLMLVLADLWERPTLARAVLAGAVGGALALVRSEQLALLVIAVAPILLLNRRITIRRRLAWTGAAALAALVLIAPWTIYNLGRFEEPVLLSTNMGGTLLAGNCPPTTYSGDLLGFYDIRCIRQLGPQHARPRPVAGGHRVRSAAFDNMRDNVDRLPATVLARHGRMLGVFRPAQTVDFAASWFGSATWPVWAWVTSFWLLAAARRLRQRPPAPGERPSNGHSWRPLLDRPAGRHHRLRRAPLPHARGPRVVVLAAVGLDRLVRRALRSPAR